MKYKTIVIQHNDGSTPIATEYISCESHQQSLRDLWGRIKKENFHTPNMGLVVQLDNIKSAFLSAGLTEKELQ